MRLYVNIDHVATLREARQTDEPDPVAAAAIAERAGADGITVHLREDRRHIQDADVRALRARPGTVLNLELAQHPDIVRFACRLRPFQATLVPERRQEITTEGRKSTRLNSSHQIISYAVFCLKKKKKKEKNNNKSYVGK